MCVLSNYDRKIFPNPCPFNATLYSIHLVSIKLLIKNKGTFYTNWSVFILITKYVNIIKQSENSDVLKSILAWCHCSEPGFHHPANFMKNFWLFLTSCIGDCIGNFNQNLSYDN